VTFQSETVESTNTYRGFLTSIVAMATSKACTGIAINAGGVGHVVGDVITITHASAHHPLRMRVTSISSGVITGVKILDGGAFARRVASATVNAGGSGYVVGDILEIQGGTFTEKAKVKVDTLSGSAVVTVSVFETGGAYATSPPLTAAATLGVGPAAFAGNDACTLDVTMQDIIGTTAISQSSSSGSGTAASFDLTLIDTGWTALWNKNEATHDGLTDEKEVVLRGSTDGADAPHVGFISYRQSTTNYGLALFGMTAFDPAAALSAQPNVGPIAWTLGTTSGSHVLVTEEAAEGNLWWLRITARAIRGAIRGNVSGQDDSYHDLYVGLGNNFAPTPKRQYPMVVAGSSNEADRTTFDHASTGMAECLQNPSGGGPVYFYDEEDTTWRTVKNGTDPATEEKDYVMWPRGLVLSASGADELVGDDGYRRFSDGTIGSNLRANVAGKIYPSPGSTVGHKPPPLTIISTGGLASQTDEMTVVCELDGCYDVGGVDGSGTVMTPEDYLGEDGQRVYLFPTDSDTLASRPYQFWGLRDEVTIELAYVDPGLPPSVPAPSGWWSSRSGADYTLSGGKLVTLIDKSANGNDFTVPVGKVGPEIVEIGGRNWIDFPVAGARVMSAANTDVDPNPNGTDFTFMAVFRCTNATSAAIFGKKDALAPFGNYGIFISVASARSLYFQMRDQAGVTQLVHHNDAGTDYSDGTSRLCMVRYDDSLADLRLYGADFLTTVAEDLTAPTIAIVPAVDLFLGDWSLSYDRAFEGELAELICWKNGFSATPQSAMQAYLEAKWGI